MILIHKLVQDALTTGYLTTDAKNVLIEMLNTKKYDLEDMNAVMSLQLATMAGSVKQEW